MQCSIVHCSVVMLSDVVQHSTVQCNVVMLSDVV